MLKIKNLTVKTEAKEIISNLSLNIKNREIHALMGPNGSGKTSLCFSIMGHPDYKISKGKIMFDGKDITALATEKRAKLGIFISFQEPPEINGVGIYSFFMTAASKQGQKHSFNVLNEMEETGKSLGFDKEFLDRNLNEGFSGGEKKKCELLQLVILKPRIVILDEIDAGLDADALKIAVQILKKSAKNGAAILAISHSPRMLKMIKPDKIHIIKNGKIVRSGNNKLIKEIEKYGYKNI